MLLWQEGNVDFQRLNRLKKINEAIAVKEEELKSLKAQRKELEVQKKQEDLSEIYEIISASGKSMEEVKVLLAKQ